MIVGTGEGFSYADALTKAREKISMAEMKIELPRFRRTVNGGRLIEIPGPNGPELADQLAARLRVVFGSEATVTRLTTRGELRLTGLDDSVTAAEVGTVIARDGGCSVDEVKVGPIRTMTNGLGSVWLQCPLSAAVKVSASGRIRIGWTVARAELLKARPVQCYRCWQFGHVKFACKAPIDRGGLCFRCGTAGHIARNCQAAPCCAICSGLGLDSGHRVGMPQCSAHPDRAGTAGVVVPEAVAVMQPNVDANVVSDRRTEEMEVAANGD